MHAAKVVFENCMPRSSKNADHKSTLKVTIVFLLLISALRVNVCQHHVNNVLHEDQDALSFLKEVATHTALKPERLGAALPKPMHTGPRKWPLQLNSAEAQNVKKHCIWLQFALHHQL